MNKTSKIFFWIFTIALGFVNPLISFALIVLYYLPGIIQSLCNECKDNCEKVIYEEYTEYKEQPINQNMNDYSDVTLEEMK